MIAISWPIDEIGGSALGNTARCLNVNTIQNRLVDEHQRMAELLR